MNNDNCIVDLGCALVLRFLRLCKPWKPGYQVTDAIKSRQVFKVYR